MGLLTFGINLTVDGCVDHLEGLADEETHAFFTGLLEQNAALLWGRVTYEMMESHWPAVARGEVPTDEGMRAWAATLEARPKYVASTTRSEYPWSNSHHLTGDLHEAVQRLKDDNPGGVLVGSVGLANQLDRWDLVDEYRLLLHPMIAAHGPRLHQAGLPATRRLDLVRATPMRNGAVALHYRRVG